VSRLACACVLFRQFTNEQLAACGEAVAAFASLVLDRLGDAAGPLVLRANPFDGPERETGPDEARRFLSRLGRDRIEVFDLYARAPASVVSFPFVFRVCAALTQDVYKYQDRHYSKMPYPPPCAHGYRIDCALSMELLEGMGADAEKVLLRAFQELFERSGAVYGYATVTNLLTVFSGYSDLERERNAPDRKYRAMWCDSLRRNVSGAFAANWLGPDLSSRLPRTRPGAGWQPEELGNGGLAVVAGTGLSVEGASLRELEAWMADLLPAEERVSLPQTMRDSLLLRPGEVERLGGPAFLRDRLGVWALTELPSGRAVLTAEYRFRSEDQVTAECLWPLRPAKRELWEIDVPPVRLGGVSYLIDVLEPARAQVRLRIPDGDLSSEGVEICIAVTGSAGGLARATGALEAWAARQGRRLRTERKTAKLFEGRIWLDGAGLDDLVDLAEEVRSAVGKRALLLILGAMPEDELAMRLQMTGLDRLFMLL
jgi:hypothetical protein